MALGVMNPLPLKLGGLAPTEQVYLALRAAQGRSNDGSSAAGPQDGLRDLWTQCVAKAIARSGRATERAILQFWPATMTTALSEWETLLGLPSTGTLPDRQAAVASAITAQLDATIPGLTASLFAISDQIGILPVPFTQSITVEPGRVFGALPGVPGAVPFFTGQAAVRGQASSQWPNYSDGFLLRVVWYPSVNFPVPPPAVAQAVAALLAKTLPAWCSWIFVTLNLGVGGAGPSGAGMYFDHAHGAVMDWSAMF